MSFRTGLGTRVTPGAKEGAPNAEVDETFCRYRCSLFFCVGLVLLAGGRGQEGLLVAAVRNICEAW